MILPTCRTRQLGTMRGLRAEALACLCLGIATSTAFLAPAGLPQWRTAPGGARRRGGVAMMSDSNAETVMWLRGLSNTWDGSRYQFKDVTLSLQRGQKVGLIGVNGCGKSTLLRAVAGLEKCEAGDITTIKGTSVVYVDQEPDFPPGMLVKDAVFSGTGPEMAVIRDYQVASDALVEGTDAAYDRFTKASAAMDAVGGWDIETYANQVMDRLNIAHLHDKDTALLSGGERKRVGLACALVRRPDVLLLDEPSNHLDVSAIEWLEAFLRQKDLTYIVVTHDRYFLEAVCSDIWELEAAQLYRYTGNYETFLEAKAARLSSMDSQRSADLKKLMRELEWMRKQPKARQAKSKAREGAFHELVKKTTKGADVKKLSLQSAQARLGNFVLAFNDANLRYEAAAKDILRSFTYEFIKGDRVGVVGPNGVGKTTFVRTLIGDIPLTSGEVIKGETVRFAHYGQMGMDFDPDVRVLDLVKDAAEEALVNEATGVATDDPNAANGVVSGEMLARQLLQRFQFPVPRWQDVVSKLSGGERRRLQLLWVLVQRPNFLVLDEPSNDLDLQTLQALEEFLTEEYQGVLVVVSHDRRFMDKVVKHLFVFEGDGIVRDFQGTFTDYLELDKEMQAEKKELAASNRAAGGGASNSSKASAEKKSSSKRQLNSREKKELQGMEKAIETLHKQKKDYDAKLEKGHEVGAGFGELSEWANRVNKIQQEIDQKEERWMELLEIAEGAGV